MQKDIKNKRFGHIDLIETLAIIFVVFYHSSYYIFDFVNEPNFLYCFRYYLRTFVSTCCPLFFFANGYLLLPKELDLKKHYRKVLRFFIIMSFWGLVELFVLQFFKGEYMTPGGMIYGLVTLRADWINHLWFMGAMIAIYLFFPLIKVVFDHDKKIFLISAITLFILTIANISANYTISSLLYALNLAETRMKHDFFQYFSFFGLGSRMYSFVYFAFGGLACFYEEKIRKIRHRNIYAIVTILISSVLLFLVGVCYSEMKKEVWDVVWSGYDTIFTFMMTLSIYALSLNYKGGNKVIETISRNTLGIYLLHPIVKPVLVNILYRYPINSYFLSLLFSLFTIAVTFLLVQMIKKIPVLRDLI